MARQFAVEHQSQPNARPVDEDKRPGRWPFSILNGYLPSPLGWARQMSGALPLKTLPDLEPICVEQQGRRVTLASWMTAYLVHGFSMALGILVLPITRRISDADVSPSRT